MLAMGHLLCVIKVACAQRDDTASCTEAFPRTAHHTHTHSSPAGTTLLVQRCTAHTQGMRRLGTSGLRALECLRPARRVSSRRCQALSPVGLTGGTRRWASAIRNRVRRTKAEGTRASATASRTRSPEARTALCVGRVSPGWRPVRAAAAPPAEAPWAAA